MPKREGWYLLRRWSLFLLLLITRATLADASVPLTVVLDEHFTQQKLGLGLEYRSEDPARQSTPEQVNQASDWHISQQGSLNFGFGEQVYWVRFVLVNPGTQPQDLILDIAYPVLDFVDVYALSTDGSPIDHVALGDHLPARARPILHSHFLVPLTVLPGAGKTVLVKVFTKATNQLPIQVWRNSQFVADNYWRTTVRGLFYGLLAAMVLYHLALFGTLREKSLLFYAVGVLGVLMVFVRLEGMETALLWPDSLSAGDHLMVTGLCAAVVFMSLFHCSVLDLASARPSLNWLLRGLVVIDVVLYGVSYFAPHEIILRLAMGLGLIAIILNMTASIIRAVDRYPPARITLFALGFFYISLATTLLNTAGFLPSNTVTESVGLAGTALSMMFYSFAISSRMNLARAQREEAQLQLTRDLDSKVRERSEALEAANTQLLHASITDALTQVFNRRHFDEIFAKEFRRAFREKTPLSILLLDIDHFKRLNDTYGHPFGDLCLQAVAERISQCVRRPPDLVARYGGEEFVVVLPNTSQEGALHVAGMINQAIADMQVRNEQHVVQMTASVGVATCVPEIATGQEVMLKHADNCLYQAKAKGRNRVEYQA